MISRIFLLCLIIAVLPFAGIAQEKGDETAEEGKKVDAKNVAGIIIQIILVIIFLGVVYYVFVFPEKRGEKESKEQTEEPSEKEQTEEKEEGENGTEGDSITKDAEPVQEEEEELLAKDDEEEGQ
jgi:flagellar biosynthesis/type III secretory pathway M-ring protein FliF/YscJ